MHDKDQSNELTDETLLAYLDGEVDPDLVKRIENSPGCLKRVEELAKIQGQLLQGLYRYACPDSTELGEYYLGMLSRGKTRAIKKHLAECPHCTMELAELERFMGQDKPVIESSISGQVRVLVAQLVSGLQSGFPAPTPAPAYALRGAEPGILVYQVDGIQISLDIQPDTESPAHRNILGLITGHPAQGYQVNLVSGGDSIAAAEVDEIANFILPKVPTGVYQLLISSPDVEIRLDLTIQDQAE